MDFRRLIPDPGTVELTALLDGLELAARAPSERPYVVANFVASADGRATVQGRSGGLGDDGDRTMFHGLRERFDAVMAGTGTIGTEHYGRILGKPERRARRVERGRTPEPLAVIFTRSGYVPPDVPLFAEPEARVVIFTSSAPELSRPAAQVEIIELDRGELTLTTAMRRLRSDFGIATLLCEGGPMLFAALLGEGLVDELFLTLAPLLTGGGTAPTITSGPELPEPQRLQLRWLLERHGSLFFRYSLR